MKKGFTLVELLGVLIIIALISIIGTAGVISLKKGINKRLWLSNIEFIEKGAINFGNDKMEYIKSKNESCEIDGKTYTPCLKISVQKLIDKNYLNTKDSIRYNEIANYKVITNPNIEKDENDDVNFENGYYVNRNEVYIYIENNIAYAKYIE